MLRHVTPIFLATALLMSPAAAFALDRASAEADQGRVAANEATPAADDIPPKPIKKKLRRSPFKTSIAAKKKSAPAAPTAASDGAPKATKTN
jgi:hypothetical protein